MQLGHAGVKFSAHVRACNTDKLEQTKTLFIFFITQLVIQGSKKRLLKKSQISKDFDHTTVIL